MNIINPYRFGAAAFDGFGNASRSFDGNDQIEMGDVLDSVFAGTGKQWTITAWVKSTTLNDKIFFSKWLVSGNSRALFLRVTSGGDLAVSMSSDGTTSNRWGKRTDIAPISADTWHHCAVTYDQTATGDYLRLWVDGVEDATPTDYLHSGTFTSIYDGTASIHVSGIDGSVTSDWTGNIADVRVYDTDISDSAIVGLSNGTDYQTNLVGWWITDVNDGTTTIPDYASTNDGTNNGSTYDADGPAD